MFDTLITGGQVIDGLGNPQKPADVGLNGDKIAAIGNLTGQEAHRTVDAKGMIVCPGFIDSHSHSDWTLLVNRPAQSAVRQGVTTEVVGNCGFSWATVKNPDQLAQTIPAYVRDQVTVDWRTFADYLHKLENPGVSINVVPLVGHGALRISVMGYEARLPSIAEMQSLKSCLADAMDSGAAGMSLGLQFAPGSTANQEELVELGKVVASRGGLVAVHMREYGSGFLGALEETLAMARDSGAKLQISHISPYDGRAPEGAWERGVAMMEKARSEGVDVAFDLHPYLWGMCGMNVILPTWAFEGGVKNIQARLKDPATRERIKSSPKEHTFAHLLQEGSWNKLRLAYAAGSCQFVGKTFDQIAGESGKNAYDAALDILAVEGEGMLGVSWLGQLYGQALQWQVFQHPLAMIEADGRAMAVEGPLASVGCHPRFYGWTARMLGFHVRDQKALTPEQAIYKMTALPARHFRLADRGRIAEGARADLVVLELASIRDNATYERPAAYPSGFRQVWVNGQAVIADGEHTGALPGQVCRLN